MAMASDTTWVGKKPIRRIGGMSDALSIAAYLGFSVATPPSQDDKSVAHLTHVSEFEKKIKTLSRIATVLKDVLQNKDGIIARLQQPYSLDCIPVEAEYQKQFSELQMKAARDYSALTAFVLIFSGARTVKNLLQFTGNFPTIQGWTLACKKYHTNPPVTLHRLEG